MSKYTHEQKLEAVMNVIEKHMSLQESAKLLGTSKELVRGWLKRYETFGTEWLFMKQGSYDGQFKIDVIEFMHTNHLSAAVTSAQFGIPSHSTVLKWERIYYEEGRQALFRDSRGRSRMTNKNNFEKPKIKKGVEEDLIAEVQRLRMEVDYLKKLNALIQQKRVSARKTKHK